MKMNSLSLLITMEPQNNKLAFEMEASAILAQSEAAIESATRIWKEAADLCRSAHLSAISTLQVTQTTTAGHSNTDHNISLTGDSITDRLAEYKRQYSYRQRAKVPESKAHVKWDKPRIPGQRRRRIVRDTDLPSAPPEPPPSGYVVFVGQMTTKIRHDRPGIPHHQPTVVQEISSMWKHSLTDEDRNYYTQFSEEARQEYKQQEIEFRATGDFTKSEAFEKVEGANLWVRKPWHAKNALERELSTYETHSFPARPPEMDEEYERRSKESQLKRKLKLREGTKKEDRKHPPKLKDPPKVKEVCPTKMEGSSSLDSVGESAEV